MPYCFRFLFSVILLLPFLSFSQTRVTGYIHNAETGEALPAANIQIEGTLRGTITNNDGLFHIGIETFPATLLVSYIGFESQELRITAEPQEPLNILLKPIILETDAIIVTAEDPAINIMRKVIEKKQKWRAKLQTYQAKAYSRLVLSNDSGIVMIAESISEAFWDKKKGPREVIKSKRQTGNMNQEGNFANASYIPNFYDDEIEINGFRIIGPTHHDALEYYTFKLTGQRMRDDDIVYDIEVIPTSRLQPTFTGHIAVIDEEYALLEVDLKPNDTILFPPPIQSWNLYYKQQFSNFGKDFWLPVDVRIDGKIKIGFTGLQFPAISYSQLSHLDDYRVNTELPDSLYEQEKIFTTDSTTIDSAELFVKSPEVVPLSVEEDSAYATLDSTATMDKAFRPTGVLARFVITESNADREQDEKKRSMLSGFSPHLRFNRVDAFSIGVNYNRNLTNNFKSKVSLNYKTGTERWGYGMGFVYDFHKNMSLSARYLVDTKRPFQSDNYSMMVSSLLPLLGKDDYFDYYWDKSFHAELGKEWNRFDVTLVTGLNDAWHSSLEKNTDFNIVGSDKKQRVNPGVSEGHLTSFFIRLRYGDERAPFGVVGQRRIELSFEHSAPGFLDSDFDFTRYALQIDWRINTFLKRRLLPNALDLRLILGSAAGDLPVQKMHGIDGNFYAFSPFGAFRTLSGRHYAGEETAALFWEHNFRTVPFELLGLDYLARKGLSIIVHGGHGRTWLKNDEAYPYLHVPQEWHHECGVSLNSLFGMLRLDLTRRLDRPGYYFGAGFARFF